MTEGAKVHDVRVDTTKGLYDDYKPGAKDSFGNQIGIVIGLHRNMVVYITVSQRVGWQYDVLPEHLRPAVVEFQILEGLANHCFSNSNRLRRTATDLLAKSLYSGLLCEEGQNPKEKFDEARRFVVDRACGRARLYYVSWSMLCAASFGLAILFHTRWHLPGIPLVGILGGLLGALISIIQRGWKLPVDPLASVYQLSAQGLIRVALGAIFGAFLVIASKANLTLGNIASDSWALFGFSTAAGFSERFVPDLLKNSLDKLG